MALTSKNMFSINSGSKFERDFGISYEEYINKVVKERDENYRKRLSGISVEEPPKKSFSPIRVVGSTEDELVDVKNKVIDDGFDEELFYRVFDLVQQNRPNGESNWVKYVPYEKKVIRNDVYHPVYKISHYPISKKFDIEIYYVYGYVNGDSLQSIQPKCYYINYNTRPDEYNLLLGCLEFWKNQQIIENKKQELALQYRVSFWQKLKLSILRIARDLLLRLKRV